jgi:TPR repeat protein
MNLIKYIQNLIAEGETQEAIQKMLEILESNDKDLHKQIILVSGQFRTEKLKARLGLGIDTIALSRINMTILDVLDEAANNPKVQEYLSTQSQITVSIPQPEKKLEEPLSNYEADLKRAQAADDEEDLKKIIAILSKYEDNLDLTGIRLLAGAYILDDEDSGNYKKGMKLLEKGAEQDDLTCSKLLAINTYSHAETSKEYEQARLYIASLVNKLDADDPNLGDLYLMLGSMYMEGDGIPKNEKTGEKYFKLSAEHDKVEAMVILMNHFLDGTEDSDLNELEAMKWAKKAAAHGSIEAIRFLGSNYYSEGDYDNAAAYLSQTAEAGDVHSLLLYGYMFQEGEGVEKNEREAAKFYRKGAEENDPACMTNLANLYVNGTGVPVDYKKALDYYLRASEQEFGAANYMLGILYKNGTGVEKNKALAKKYLQLAVAQEFEAAQAELDSLNSFWGNLF